MENVEGIRVQLWYDETGDGEAGGGRAPSLTAPLTGLYSLCHTGGPGTRE